VKISLDYTGSSSYKTESVLSPLWLLFWSLADKVWDRYPHILLCREVLQRLESEAECLCIESDSMPSLQQEISLLAQKVSGEGILKYWRKSKKKCSFTMKLNNIKNATEDTRAFFKYLKGQNDTILKDETMSADERYFFADFYCYYSGFLHRQDIFILAGLAAKELPGYREEAARKLERRLLVELSAQLLNTTGRPTSFMREQVAAPDRPTSIREQVAAPGRPTSLSEQVTAPGESIYVGEQVAASDRPSSLREQVAAPDRPTYLSEQLVAPDRSTSLREQVAAPYLPTYLTEQVAAPGRPTSMAVPGRPTAFGEHAAAPDQHTSLREQLAALDWGLDRLLRPDLLELAGRSGKEVDEEWQRFRKGFLQLVVHCK
jgi:hypothetical protein